MAGLAPPSSPTPAGVPATAHVYVERLDDTVTVVGDDGHHLQRARRVRPGETVTAADGYGRWRVFTVVEAAAGAVVLEATSALAHEPRLQPTLTVACALTKGEKPELVVQKLTELGVDGIVFVEAARSVVRWGDAKAAAAMDRLRRVAREAGAESRRCPHPRDRRTGRPRRAARASRTGRGRRRRRARPRAPQPVGGAWVVAVGPEGGFDDAELRDFGTAPRLAVGPFVLRGDCRDRGRRRTCGRPHPFAPDEPPRNRPQRVVTRGTE